MMTMKRNDISASRVKNGKTYRSGVAIGALLFTLSFSSIGNAQSTGVAACDDFLEKYTTCVTSKMPAAVQSTYKTQLDQTRKMWLDMAKNPGAKSAMEASCKQTMDSMKTALSSYGCSF
jgi:hypothetical protein